MASATKTTKSGKERKVALSSKKKWQLYFELERQVLNEVQKYLRLTKNRYFLEHDGWATEHQINEHELNEYIKHNIGFDVKFKMEQLENIKSLTTTSPSVRLLYGNLEQDIDEIKRVIKLN
jgi:predicted DNA-binding ArsR family transcriptional regulator